MRSESGSLLTDTVVYLSSWIKMQKMRTPTASFMRRKGKKKNEISLSKMREREKEASFSNEKYFPDSQ